MTAVSPWNDTLTSAQHSLIFYALAVAGLALGAYSLKAFASRSEVGVRYRPAVLAGAAITAVAFVSYVVLVVKFDLGYDPGEGGDWIANSDALWSWAPRYFDWSVTVPLLVVELIAMSTLATVSARRLRFVGVVAAFAMIFTGYLGGVVVDDGRSVAALLVWGIVSGLFMVLLYVLIAYAVVSSLRDLPPGAGTSYRNAMILLMVVWFAYPIAYGFQGLGEGGWRITTMQLLLSAADVAAKVGFAVLIHKVAKLRTAHDVETGIDTHPDSVWISATKHSSGLSAARSKSPGSPLTRTPLAEDPMISRRTPR